VFGGVAVGALVDGNRLRLQYVERDLVLVGRDATARVVVDDVGVSIPFPAWQFGTDGCSIRREGERVLVIACPSDGGVVAAEAGPEIGANQERDHYLPVVWVRLDP
jgi:hypothetical protein